MTVYIVINMTNYQEAVVESVWTTWALADSARHYHAFHANGNLTDYVIIERELDKTRAER